MPLQGWTPGRTLTRREAVRLGLGGAALWATPAFPRECPSDQKVPAVAAINNKICNAIENLSLPSASYALITGGQIQAAKAFGWARPDVEATDRTLYQAASISKTLAAVVALYAVQTNRGGLTLDADISTFHPSWQLPAGKQSNEFPVTLRRLLDMTSGANISGFKGYPKTCIGPSPCKVPSLVQILNGGAPANNPPVQILEQPGDAWIYSGGGYEVAESLIGDVTNSSYADFAQSAVMNTLGMSRSAWGSLIPVSSADEAAYGYVEPNKTIERGWDAYPQLAAAGLWTTPREFAAVLIDIWAAYSGAAAAKVLNQASAQAMMTANQSTYGLGGAVRNSGPQTLFMKSGGNRGFSNWLAFYPALGDGLIVFTNYDGKAKDNWKAHFFNPLFLGAANDLGWPSFPGLQDNGNPPAAPADDEDGED